VERGKFILNQDIHRPKSRLKNEQFASINLEIKCYLQKQFLSHWVIKDLVINLIKKPLEFVVFTTSNWFPHNFCVKNMDLQLKVLGDSNNGPILIEHGNCIACNFHINSKYKDTVKILENFIKNRFYTLVVKLF
jgi:hypothetical protein